MKFAGALVCLLLTVACAAQQKPKAPAPKPIVAGPPIAASTGIYYPVPPEVALKLKLLQHKDDLLEIENLRMQVKTEQNLRMQEELRYEEQGVAFDYASEKKIDLGLFELDMRDEVKFIPKKKAP